MIRQEFTIYLKDKGYSYSVITGYPTECGWIEKNLCVDLDQEYDKDRLQSLLDRLQYNEGRNPLCKLISGNPYTNLATYRRAATSYRKFLDARKAVRSAPTHSLEPVTTVSRPQEPRTAPVALSTAAICPDFTDLVNRCTVSELLAVHAAALDELQKREIVRSANAPGGDYAELLFVRAFGWTRAENSTAGHDAIDWSGRRYQIKSRRLSQQSGRRQLSAIRRLPDEHFNFLAAVLFEKDYKIHRAAMIPHETVLSHSKFQSHTNSWIFYLDDTVWSLPGVGDVTQQLRSAAEELDRR